MKHDVWSSGLILVAAVFVLPAIFEFLKRNPCLFRSCAKKHLTIDKRYWTEGSCARNDHPYHGSKTLCYITKWICTRPRCGAMGFYCVGDASKGAWTIQYGKVVPDEKEWTKWS